MRRLALLTVITACFAGLHSPAAFAHHSTNGLYNEDETVEITGKVKEWRFINPHPSLVIEVAGPDGEMQEWDVSYGGPAVTQLKNMGYTADTFEAGDLNVVRGYAAKVQTAYGLLILGHPTKVDGSPIIGAQRP